MKPIVCADKRYFEKKILYNKGVMHDTLSCFPSVNK
jgi:hypothetical protein